MFQYLRLKDNLDVHLAFTLSFVVALPMTEWGGGRDVAIITIQPDYVLEGQRTQPPGMTGSRALRLRCRSRELKEPNKKQVRCSSESCGPT